MNASSLLESADFVARFQALSRTNVTVPSEITESSLPAIVQNRLNVSLVRWTDLTGHAQRALLWDSGFVLARNGSNYSFVQVYVRQAGMTMADIILPFNSTTTTCASTPKRHDTFEYVNLESVLRCAIDPNALLNVPLDSSSAWAQDGSNSTTVPTLRIRVHKDRYNNLTFPSIHSAATEPPAGTCTMSGDISFGLIVPCTVRRPNDGFQLPSPSPTMAAWLEGFSQSTQKNSPESAATVSPLSAPRNQTDLYWGIGAGCVGIMIVLFAVVYRKWKRLPENRRDQSGYVNRTRLKYHSSSDHFRPTNSSSPFAHDPKRRSSSFIDPSFALSVLSTINDEMCLAIESVSCDEILASTAQTEIYYGFYNHRPVAIKTVTLKQSRDKDAVNAFALEIKLMALMNHPNIVSFIGYTWNNRSISSLMAVTEYLSQGNLAQFLTENPNLDWNIKATFALDIALAIQYLHETLTPHILHRDLKSKNILMDWPHVKLSGFGLTRQTHEDVVSAGRDATRQGYYMAPEVIASGEYSTAADIYSLGCILVEIDTQEPLYTGLEMPSGHVMLKIARDGLRPMWRDNCPTDLQKLMHKCLAFDPAARPTASDVVRCLDIFVNDQGNFSRFI
ncbi:unnamed protein product [Aphanomyces euteiches]|uniref:Protein kinase domain-containing protein n=1 Tax=Aphanomyces euteiches TaxID=100861 RepID=A0A6G0XLL1_9STRA|nr:hypothetical protein Ae201684_003674 [Aphanomyces euteiches]KAH9084719.1 hypothetical protein Ae201684P_001959 [Aphanomyces euteiches]KAH9138705.1 hypothetical protein AeRB84_016997 [Aphanomyces euteiches]